jgi:hypothetical protein
MAAFTRRLTPGSSQVANKATLNLILGVFLKLLGFFVVMYTYTDISPTKARQAEESLHQRFNISVSFLHEMAKNTADSSLSPVQDEGRSFNQIKDALKTQVDFLSTQYQASSKTLILTLPAEILFPLNGNAAKSPDFARTLANTLQQQGSATLRYKIEIIANGSDNETLIKEVSRFAQKLLAADYPEKDLTTGYKETIDAPTVDLRLTQVVSGAKS